MIPKIIHYCWFGKKAIPLQFKEYINSWKHLLKGYEFKKWDESNSPMYLPYMQNAHSHRNWANMSNYMRLHALYKYGGIYLDTDVELLKSLDGILHHKCFLAFETAEKHNDFKINNAIIGAIPKHPFILICKTQLLYLFDGTENAAHSSPILTTLILRKWGVTICKEQTIRDVHIFTREVFYPFYWNESPDIAIITESTITKHHWAISWKKTESIVHQVLKKLWRLSPVWIKYGKIGFYLSFHRKVLSGPFKGMKYVKMASVGSSLMPKLLGTYESCLHYTLYELIEGVIEFCPQIFNFC